MGQVHTKGQTGSRDHTHDSHMTLSPRTQGLRSWARSPSLPPPGWGSVPAWKAGDALCCCRERRAGGRERDGSEGEGGRCQTAASLQHGHRSDCSTVNTDAGLHSQAVRSLCKPRRGHRTRLPAQLATFVHSFQLTTPTQPLALHSNTTQQHYTASFTHYAASLRQAIYI